MPNTPPAEQPLDEGKWSSGSPAENAAAKIVEHISEWERINNKRIPHRFIYEIARDFLVPTSLPAQAAPDAEAKPEPELREAVAKAAAAAYWGSAAVAEKEPIEWWLKVADAILALLRGDGGSVTPEGWGPITDDVQSLREAFHETTSALLTRKHAADITEQLARRGVRLCSSLPEAPAASDKG